MIELKFYKSLVKPFLSRNNILSHRVEAPGLPDVYTSKFNNVAWIELKCVKKPSREGTIRPNWRKGQLAFVQRIKMYGGDYIYLALYYEITKEFYLLRPREQYYEEELELCLKNQYLMKMKHP